MAIAKTEVNIRVKVPRLTTDFPPVIAFPNFFTLFCKNHILKVLIELPKSRPKRICLYGIIPSPMTNIARKMRSEEHTSELQSRGHLVCRLLLEKKNTSTILQLSDKEIILYMSYYIVYSTMC